MTQRSQQKQDTAQPRPGQVQPGAEYGEAGDPGDTQGAKADAGARYSGSLQARSGQQGQVSGRSSGEVAARGGASEAQASAMMPPVDIFEDEGGVTLLADMPGVSREQLHVRVDGENLLIEGSATVPEVGQMELVHGEVMSPHYRRSFTLSRDLDAGKIEAKLTQGVLRLHIPKAEQAKPRRIEVKVG